MSQSKNEYLKTMSIIFLSLGLLMNILVVSYQAGVTQNLKNRIKVLEIKSEVK